MLVANHTVAEWQSIGVRKWGVVAVTAFLGQYIAETRWETADVHM